MKYLLTIIFASAISLAHGQSLEIGAITGASFNLNFLTSSAEQNYLSQRSGLYIHFPSQKRISYELSITYYRHSANHIYHYNWYDGEPVYSNETVEDNIHDQFLELSISRYYNFHKPVPFENRRFNNYFGISAGLLANMGHIDSKHSFQDTSVIYNYTYAPYHSLIPILGISYLGTYSISKHLMLNCLISYKLTSDIFESDIATYMIYSTPSSFLSAQFGLSYKFSSVSRETRIK